MRPVIGAAASLLLHLINAADLLKLNCVGLYALAVGFGFSERAFFRLLGGIAGKSDTAVAARVV